MRARAYRVLCGAMGGLLILAGLAFALQFFRYHGFAYANPPGTPNPFPLDAYAVYFIALAGCAFLGWGAGLVAAARRPALGRGIGSATALALVLMALHRIVGWMLGDYPLFDALLRTEAALFLLLALAFVWLRPAAQAGIA